MNFWSLSVKSSPKAVGSILKSIQSPAVPLLAIMLSLKNVIKSYLSWRCEHAKTREYGSLLLLTKNNPFTDNPHLEGLSLVLITSGDLPVNMYIDCPILTPSYLFSMKSSPSLSTSIHSTSNTGINL